MKTTDVILTELSTALKNRDERILKLEKELAEEKANNYDSELVTTNAVAIRSVVHVGRNASGTAGRLWLNRYNQDIMFETDTLAEDWDRGKLASTFLSHNCPVGKVILERVTIGERMKFYMTILLEPVE